MPFRNTPALIFIQGDSFSLQFFHVSADNASPGFDRHIKIPPDICILMQVPYIQETWSANQSIVSYRGWIVSNQYIGTTQQFLRIRIIRNVDGIFKQSIIVFIPMMIADQYLNRPLVSLFKCTNRHRNDQFQFNLFTIMKNSTKR